LIFWGDTKKSYEQERDQWKQQLNTLQSESDEYLTKAEEEFDFVCGITKRFLEGSIKERKFIFARIGSNLILNDEKLTLEVGQPYLKIKELRKLAPNRLELPKTLCDSGLMASLERDCPAWYPLRDRLRKIYEFLEENQEKIELIQRAENLECELTS